jgi:shikimate dehydrogenase
LNIRKFGLIGYPLGHSFSKQFFTEKFRKESINDCSYDNYPLDNIKLLPELVASEDDLCGLNVTIPYKTAVIPYLTDLDNEAVESDAVNVIKISGEKNDRKLKGFNTDIYGFRETILPYLSNFKFQALILGTGGGSKAVAYVLASLGIKYSIVSRNPGIDCLSYNDLNEEVLSVNRLIVNTTPQGMFPEENTFPDIKYSCLDQKHILFDLVYNPEMTVFMKKGKERGCTVIGGLKMLHLQAEKAWSIWNDSDL